MVLIAFVWEEGADRTLDLPSYETEGAAGADLRANFAPEARAGGVTLAPGARVLVPTGAEYSIRRERTGVSSIIAANSNTSISAIPPSACRWSRYLRNRAY
mgnify:CR=1 FL=1